MSRAESASWQAGSYTVEIDRVAESEWSEILPSFDDATIYQTWAYGATCWGEDQLHHVVLRRDGQVVAAAQLRVVRLPVLGRGVAYVRWGPMCRRRAGPWSAEAFREIVAAIAAHYARRRGLLLRIIPNVYTNDPHCAQAQSILAELGLRENAAHRRYETARLDLTPPLDELRQGLHRRWRGCVNKAEASGLAVSEDVTDEAYGEFTRMYDEMMARKHFETTVSIEEFRTIQQRLVEQLKMRIFVCAKEGGALNALVLAAAGDTGIYLLGATSHLGLKSRGAYLLQWRAIEWLKQRGFRWYDLGGINREGNPGVYEFKSGVAGQEVHQLGRYELSGSATSSLCVELAERLQRTYGRVKSRFKEGRPAPPPDHKERRAEAPGPGE